MSKTFHILIIALLISITSIAQNGINYKAMLKDASGNVLSSAPVTLQFIISDASTSVVYQESHTVNTDANGIIIVNIGEGTTADIFTDIDWASDDHFLNVQVNIGSGLVDLGTTQFMAVPYAKHANTATTALNAGATNINGLSDAKSDNDGTNDGSSIFLGVDAGANDDGTDNKNVGVGYQALFSNTTAYGNTANGYQALYANTTGFYNTANGSQALNTNTTGQYNTANGHQALSSNTIGNNNTASGLYALRLNTTGDNNVANGFQALAANDTGDNNTANGYRSLYSNLSGLGNVALGYEAGYFETGSNKLYIANSDTSTPLIYGEFDNQLLTINGDLEVTGNIIGGVTSINGLSDGKSDNDGTEDGSSLFLGIDAGTSDDGTNNQNVGVGYQALFSNITGSLNTANGYQALYTNTIGNFNTANGTGALYKNILGYYNSAIGYQALYNSLGSGNVALGYNAGYNETGSNKLYIANSGTSTPLIYGEFVNQLLRINGDLEVTGDIIGAVTSINDLSDGKTDTNGTSLFLGVDAGASDDGTNNWNVGVGYQALFSNTYGAANTANGYQALYENILGHANTAIGYQTLRLNTGTRNTAIGEKVLELNTTGYFNTANGALALSKNSTGYRNTANGYAALGLNTTGFGNVALGNTAGYNETGNNTLYIANSSTSTPLIYGEFDTKILEINGASTVKSSIDANADLVLGGRSSSATGDDGIISSDPAYAGSDIWLRSYDAVVVQLDYDNSGSSGNFEIKNSSNVEVFDVSETGNVVIAGSLTQNSDRRLKKDIEDLPYGLKEILQLQPKAYNWKDRETDYKSLGLIAQEVQPIIKEIVNAKDDDAKTLGISYTELIPILIKAIQEQQTQIEALKTKNQSQDTVLAEVLKRLNTLEKATVASEKELVVSNQNN